MIGVVLLFGLLALGDSVKLRMSANFQKCNRKEPNLKECVFKAAKHGVAQLTKPYDELNVPSINPFFLPAVTVPGTGSVAVEQKFRECNIHGFLGVELDRFEFDFDKKTLTASGNFPEIRLQCQYELDGKVLLLPIKGKGPATVTLKNMDFAGLFAYEEVKRRSQTYLKFVSSKVTIDPKLVSFKFENLFDGDEKLGNNINQVLNDNWKEVFDEVKDSYIEIINTILVSLLSGFFSKLSLEEALD